ncbi:MAG: GAF domain-containing sensor histidine kinase [Burkholderiales bacterium]|nr:GAF domain-containing sensor histidine kinase [Anaerolineae bacterium]
MSITTEISAVRGINRQDWSLFGLRWADLLVVTMALVVANNQRLINVSSEDIALAAVVSGMANLLLLPFIHFNGLRRPLHIMIILRDVVTVASFAGLTNGNPLVLLGIVSPIIVTGLLRLGPKWGGVQVVTVLLAALGALLVWLPPRADQTAYLVGILSIPLLILGLFIFIAGYWGYTLQEQSKAERQWLTRLATTRSSQLSDLRERTRGLYEVAATLSATLDYKRILDAAMDAGRLGLREHTSTRLVSMVMLFRTGDNKLQVMTSRGMARTDEARTLPGMRGIIGMTLRECIPITGDDPNKDAELQYFIAFQGLRSVLCIPLRSGYENFGVLIYASDAENGFSAEHVELLTAIGTQATIALQNAVLYANLVEEKERLVDVEEEARKQLARDLHDGPVQTISAIAMRMNTIHKMLERTPEQAPQELTKIEQLARNTVKEIRHMLFTLRPLVLETQGLAAALKQLAEKMQDTHGQKVSAFIGRDVESYLTSQQQGVIFYIVEEAVNNARKHAEAEVVRVDVSYRDEMVIVQVVDNGVGFDTGAVDGNYEYRGSLGMVNMRERAQLLEGSLKIESAEGSGTTVTVFIPTKGEHKPERRALLLKQPMTKTRLAAAALARVESLRASTR